VIIIVRSASIRQKMHTGPWASNGLVPFWLPLGQGVTVKNTAVEIANLGDQFPSNSGHANSRHHRRVSPRSRYHAAPSPFICEQSIHSGDRYLSGIVRSRYELLAVSSSLRKWPLAYDFVAMFIPGWPDTIERRNRHTVISACNVLRFWNGWPASFPKEAISRYFFASRFAKRL
jgi:hypothetical protein